MLVSKSWDLVQMKAPYFIQLAQTLKYYGYIKFEPCITDFPEKGCHVIVSAGNNELNFQVKLPNEQMKEGSFKVTRMRCWRVTSSMPFSNGSGSPNETEVRLELAFEYLMSKDRLQWITISSPQAIMMSICLQSMVDELMVKKSGGSIKKVKAYCCVSVGSVLGGITLLPISFACTYQRFIVLQLLRKRQSYLRRSDSQQAVKSPPLLDSPDSSREPIVKLSSKLSSVSLRGISTSNSTGDMSADDFHGNYAFEGIGDDDL
ncbi:hypothetical protein XELAEV_18028418mg [Xenopus laevis]|uniref:Sorting nexin-17/31 FERM domain-containing protein n=1 Tax=Xenopus laevis TaxID=8355 RepID=A0A974CZD5_XENLA|nr:hypothetical protein XELAEV_18028418mg [Xenopus laevis]